MLIGLRINVKTGEKFTSWNFLDSDIKLPNTLNFMKVFSFKTLAFLTLTCQMKPKGKFCEGKPSFICFGIFK